MTSRLTNSVKTGRSVGICWRCGGLSASGAFFPLPFRGRMGLGARLGLCTDRLALCGGRGTTGVDVGWLFSGAGLAGRGLVSADSGILLGKGGTGGKSWLGREEDIDLELLSESERGRDRGRSPLLAICGCERFL